MGFDFSNFHCDILLTTGFTLKIRRHEEDQNEMELRAELANHELQDQVAELRAENSRLKELLEQ